MSTSKISQSLSSSIAQQKLRRRSMVCVGLTSPSFSLDRYRRLPQIANRTCFRAKFYRWCLGTSFLGFIGVSGRGGIMAQSIVVEKSLATPFW